MEPFAYSKDRAWLLLDIASLFVLKTMSTFVDLSGGNGCPGRLSTRISLTAVLVVMSLTMLLYLPLQLCSIL